MEDRQVSSIQRFIDIIKKLDLAYSLGFVAYQITREHDGLFNTAHDSAVWLFAVGLRWPFYGSHLDSLSANNQLLAILTRLTHILGALFGQLSAHVPSHHLAGYPGLVYISQGSRSGKRVSFRVQLLFKSLLGSYLPVSHWPPQVTGTSPLSPSVGRC